MHSHCQVQLSLKRLKHRSNPVISNVVSRSTSLSLLANTKDEMVDHAIDLFKGIQEHDEVVLFKSSTLAFVEMKKGVENNREQCRRQSSDEKYSSDRKSPRRWRLLLTEVLENPLNGVVSVSRSSFIFK